MKTEKINNFCFDSNNLICKQDERQLKSLDIALKVEGTFSGLKGIPHRLYFHLIDLLAPHITWAKRKQYNIISDLCQPLIKKQEAFLQQRKSIQEMVDKHFTIVAKNVEHLDEAQVIGLGEVHRKEEHQKNNGELIDALSEPKDEILVETSIYSAPASAVLKKPPKDFNESEKVLAQLLDPKFSNQIKYVEKPLATSGWDLPLSQQNLCLNLTITPVIKIAISTCVLSGMAAIPFLFVKPITGIALGALSALSIIGTSLLSDRQEGIDLFSDMPARNRMLCQQTEEKLKPDRRVFVIAGAAHWTPSILKKKICVDYTPVVTACQETLEYFKTKKFAILIPKRL